MKPGRQPKSRATAAPWEVERLHKEFPVTPRDELEEKAGECGEEAKGSREKLTRCVQRKLSK